MFSLAFDRRHRVLMARATGVFSSDDITALDAAIVRFVSREGDLRGILDFTAVEALAVSASRLAVRGRQPPVMGTADRVFVAPQADINRFCRSFAEHQRGSGNAGPQVVTTLVEAYAALGLVDPQFEPVDVS
jgi:hypothetical protein